MPQVDPVILQLKADIQKYQRDLTGAQRLTDEKLGAIERRGATMSAGLSKGFNMAKTAAMGFVAGLGIETVTAAIGRALDYASSLGEVAQQLGVTTDALQEYRYAATQVGLSNEEMDQALSQLTRRIGEAQSGTKAQAEAFQKLGISVKGLTTGDAIPAIADAMQKIESPAERAAILMDLFGRSGQKLEPLLASGSKGVNELREAAHKLGIVLSEEQIQKADETADKLASVKKILEAKLAGVVADNSDSILEFADRLGQLADAAIKAFQALDRFSQTRIGGIIGKLNQYNPIVAAGNLAGAGINYVNGPASGGGGTPAPRRAAPTNRLRPGTDLGAGFKPTTRFAGGGLIGGPSPFDYAPGGITGGLAAISGPGGISAAISKFTGDLERMAADLDMARAELSGNVRDRAAAERRRIDYDLSADIESINANKELNAATRAQMVTIAQQTAAARKELVDKEASAEIARQEREIAQEQLTARIDAMRDEADTLQVEADVADTLRQRYEIEQRLLALQQDEENARLEAAIAAGTVADAATARANLARRQSAERERLSRGQEGPGARYMRQLREESENIGDRFEEAAVRGIERINASLADSVKNALGLHGVLGDIVGDFIEIAMRQAMLGGSGGGILGSLFGGIFGGSTKSLLKGRASGGPVARGTPYMVGESGRELFIPDRSGMIVPAGQVNAMANGGGQGGGIATVQLVLSGDIDARIQQVSGPVAIEVVRQSAPSIIDASARETMARVNRPRI